MDVIFLVCISLALAISGYYLSQRSCVNRSQPRSHDNVSTLESDTPSELIIIDTNYPSRIAQRREIIARHPTTVHGCVPEGVEPVRELYEFLLASYLPARYPTMFTLQGNKAVVNTAMGSSHPVIPPADPLQALRTLGETVEDDLFLVVETPGGHRLVAFACCFPSGFDPSSKLGRVLAEIHEPVPGYEKIGGSMERFFARLEVGKSVKRINWSVTAQEELFNPVGSHAEDPEAVERDQDVDIEKARVRMELQTLTRLPRTKAILFSFKTYLYPVRDIKEEGLGPQFADAIEGLRRGNAPGMWTYKGAVRWGKSVCEYLRS
ncbi:uncharacterized protein DNG_00106 [Cephalotrichum gorgonifer]|uniref:DUF3445 domain-containing protein n=1 Tax=Cephalotrichum gorgonifer TaxID=2041049 RepID=A0AAE8SQL2_9PEZI|nr:uncharacterized protein DNG_00106 [Cephalotrichum gorgonifer]